MDKGKFSKSRRKNNDTQTISHTSPGSLLEAACQVYDQLEAWYDEHPQASFGEIEAEVRKRRRELMGTGIEVLVNGRDTGLKVETPCCAKCGSGLEFEGYGSGLCMDWKAMWFWNGLITSVPSVRERRFFSLERSGLET